MTYEEMAETVVRMRTMMMSWAMSMARNIERANDLVQDTCLKALENFEKFIDGSVAKWLYKMMQRIFFDTIKHEYRYGDYEGVEEDYSGEEVRLEDIRIAYASVTPKFRKALALYTSGLTYREVAKEMGISVGSAVGYVNSAREEFHFAYYGK